MDGTSSATPQIRTRPSVEQYWKSDTKYQAAQAREMGLWSYRNAVPRSHARHRRIEAGRDPAILGNLPGCPVPLPALPWFDACVADRFFASYQDWMLPY
jgi:hypothetical protein